MTHDPLFFFEQTDFSLRFARCAISETSLNIEELKEVLIGDAPALSQFAPEGTQVVCALRTKPRQLHLATLDDAKRFSGLAGLQQFALQPAFAKGEPAWFAGVQASDGAPPSSLPWLISLASANAHQQARAIFETIKLKPARCLDGTLATIGAITSTISGPTLMLEIGELSSQAILVGPEGVIAARSVSLNLDQIAEAVQGELNLKFRGSAAKLFFNPDCDFTETGPKIAARIGTALKADLAPLLAGHAAPTSLSCSGLPALQQWLETQLANALGMPAYVPDVKTWSNAVGVTFGNSTLTASISPAWFNFLHFINSQTLESPTAVAWQAELFSLKTPIAIQAATKAVTMPPMTASAQRPSTAPAAPSPAKPAAAPVKPAAAIAAAVPAKPAAAVTPVPAKTPVPASKAPAVPAKTPATLGKPAATPVPAKPAAGTAAASPAKPAAAVSSVQYSAKAASSSNTTPTEKKGGKSKMPLFIGIAVLLVALAGGFYFMQSQKEESARIALEAENKQQAERATAEERARLAEQKARQEAENRKKFELETAQKLALSENARKQAEEEAKSQVASRLANARGTLVVTTEPAGATVTVGDLPPRTSPATFTYVKIGKYPVSVTLAHHEEVKLELEVTENNTTESGIIPLPTLVGSVSITSNPAGSSYELRPANTFTVTSEGRHSGQTPATVENIDPGDYTVTFSRPGWAPHTETISVVKDGTAKATWAFPTGTVKITSTPTGATISQNGAKLGITPLTLLQPPGAVRYEVKLAFHDPVTLPGTIVEGKTLELSTQLNLTDIVFGPTELDKNPEPINPKTPDLPSNLTLVEGRVVIQMTISREGVPTDLKLIRASNPEIGKIYMAAVAKWKFKPGMKDGKAVRSAVVVPFLINPSKD